MDEDQTQIVTAAGLGTVALDERVHVLEVVAGLGVGRQHVLGPGGVTVGRTAPSDIIFADPEVSRVHCRVEIRGDELFVTDLGSTNGAFVDGVRVRDLAPLHIGATLQVGRNCLRHEWRTRSEFLQSQALDRDLERAYAYVEALLPPPLRQGPIRAEWVYQPSAKLGGDAFGYGPLSGTLFAFYLIDVSGHGAGAAMHSVTVMNLLRQRAVPGADMSRPGEVLTALNDMFQMDVHNGLYFTIWYGVFDRQSRRLEYASGGHHPAFLRAPGLMAPGGELAPLRTRNGLIGAIPHKTYSADAVTAPEGSALYLFSDGVFEIVTKGGLQWGLQDFLAVVLSPARDGLTECQRLYEDVIRVARPGGLDDDFSLVILTFD